MRYATCLILMCIFAAIPACGDKYKGRGLGSLFASEWSDADAIEAAVKARGSNAGSPELSKAIHDVRAAGTATNPGWKLDVNRRLLAALENTGNVATVRFTTNKDGARVKARPPWDQSPDAVHESDLLTSQSELVLAFGKWVIWTERPGVGRTSDEETMEVSEPGLKTRVILEKQP
jgi:hypothetical protein